MKPLAIKLMVLSVLTITLALGDEKILQNVPNVSQAKDLNNNSFCGPAAAMNTLLWLRDTKGLKILRGVTSNDKIISFMNILGSNRYMKTSTKNGTTMSSLYGGLTVYLGECGYKIGSMEIRSNSIRIEGDPRCSFEWIRQMIDEEKCVIVEVSSYDKSKEPGNHVHVGGHYLTCIGYNMVGDKKELIVNDSTNEQPAQRYTVTLMESGSKVGGKAVDQNAVGAPMRLDGYKPSKGDIGIIQNVLAYAVK
jgi:predicted HTH transcriptional regulator